MTVNQLKQALEGIPGHYTVFGNEYPNADHGVEGVLRSDAHRVVILSDQPEELWRTLRRTDALQPCRITATAADPEAPIGAYIDHNVRYPG